MMNPTNTPCFAICSPFTVIGNWLKSHKCGEGLKEVSFAVHSLHCPPLISSPIIPAQDCPNELLNPGSVPAEVDVMAFLGVKRAEPVKAPDMKQVRRKKKQHTR